MTKEILFQKISWFKGYHAHLYFDKPSVFSPAQLFKIIQIRRISRSINQQIGELNKATSQPIKVVAETAKEQFKVTLEKLHYKLFKSHFAGSCQRTSEKLFFRIQVVNFPPFGREKN